MSLKLLADKYIELSVKAIAEITKDNYQNFNGIAEDYLFLYCRTGSMKIIVDDNPYELNENDIILIRINSSYSIEKENFSTIFLAFNGSSAEDLISVMEFENNMYHDDSHLGYYFYKIYHAYHEAEFLSIKCLGIFYELFYELTKNANVIDVDYNNQQKHVEIAKEYINQNYHLDISILDVSKKVGVTSNYLANIFARYLKRSPKTYLTEVRMEQAKKILATHKYKVKDVGSFVGYKNQLHFSSEFKKYTGYSPSEYSKITKNNSF